MILEYSRLEIGKTEKNTEDQAQDLRNLPLKSKGLYGMIKKKNPGEAERFFRSGGPRKF
jgi:hypothetical protein